MSDVTFVTSRVIAMDGVAYTISVYHKAEGFYAFWECLNCGRQSAPGEPSPDRDGVIARCEELIAQHHKEQHPAMANA